jgi:hypothetical protein
MGLTTLRPAARQARKSSNWRVGSRNEAGAPVAARVATMRPDRSSGGASDSEGGGEEADVGDVGHDVPFAQRYLRPQHGGRKGVAQLARSLEAVDAAVQRIALVEVPLLERASFHPLA